MRNSTEIGKIIKSKRESKKITQTHFAEKLGIHKSTLSKYEKGLRNIPMEELPIMADLLGMSIKELLLEPTNVAQINSSTVPVLSKVSAGLPMYAEENILEYSQVPSFLYKEGAEQFYLKVSGDSMNEIFKDGDLVFVEKDKPIENGQIGVVMINGYDATVKRVRYDEDKIYLIPESTNAEHLTQVYTKDDEVRFIGRVTSSQQFH